MRAQLFACLFPSVTALEIHPVLRVILTSNGSGEDTDFKKLQALILGCESRRQTCFLLHENMYNRAKLQLQHNVTMLLIPTRVMLLTHCPEVLSLGATSSSCHSRTSAANVNMLAVERKKLPPCRTNCLSFLS